LQTSLASPRPRRRASFQCLPTKISALRASRAFIGCCEPQDNPVTAVPGKSKPTTTHVATAPNQVCWDMTYLPTIVAGVWFHLYLILDLYSRNIVGWEIHDTDDSGHAAHLVRRTALAESIHCQEDRPILHGDNGSTLKATTVLAMLQWLGIKPSYSRP
jgi:putative transposase